MVFNRRRIVRIFRNFGIGLLAFIGILALVLYIRYGGGSSYPDLSTEPLLPKSALEEVFAYPEPLGNIAVSRDNRIFFTVHPESRPAGHKVLEIVDGQARPFPNAAYQDTAYTTVLGMTIDEQNRLWTIDHGNHGFDPVKILVFDLNTNRRTATHILPDEVGERLSFCNDLSISPDGRWAYIADVSFFGNNPSLIVLDTKTGTSKRLLEDHESVVSQDYIPENKTKRMSFFGGLVTLTPGIDGIVVGPKGEFVYYGAMSHEGLYRVPTAALQNFDLSPEDLGAKVEWMGKKPLSDGLSIDTLGNVYITDVDHGGIARMEPDGTLKTLIRDDDRVRWADGASFGGDGNLYFTDSAIPDQMLRSKSHMREKAPYYIYRVNPGIGGIPGR